MGTTFLAPSGGKADLPLPGVGQGLALWARILYYCKLCSFNILILIIDSLLKSLLYFDSVTLLVLLALITSRT